jgi:1-acyl-sn-glycerol-3-phosphate acyltransferase
VAVQAQLLERRDPRTIQSLMPAWRWFYRHYFRASSDGWHHLPATGAFLAVGSHNGGLAAPDTHMLAYEWFHRYGTQRPAYGLMHPRAFESPELARQLVQFGAIPAEPRIAIAALRRQAAVLVYPGGAQDVFRPYSQRHRIELAGHTGFIKLALREAVPIVPAISVGAHETLAVLTDCRGHIEQLERWHFPGIESAVDGVFPIYLGLPWGVACGPAVNFPLPARIHLRWCEPIYFPRYGRAAANDRRYVADCYERVRRAMQRSLDALVRERHASRGWLEGVLPGLPGRDPS